MKKIDNSCDWILGQIPEGKMYCELEIAIGTLLLPFVAIVSVVFSIPLPLFLGFICWYKLITFAAIFIVHAFRGERTQGMTIQTAMICLHLIDIPIANYFRKTIIA